MLASEIVPLTEEALLELLRSRERRSRTSPGSEKRATPRWPFQGTVELWFGDPDACDDYALGTCENLSVGGVGIRCDEAIDPGTPLTLALHEPERSLHGRGIVRHCTKMHHDYYIGVEFVY